ncbi:3-deoxy-D-manno-octulosonic acid transferase [Gemmobacter denitrificans]|uniref:3-deoxy-D-manno-octulosonic acid transferase n=1 Tax=Gemmobacter denitrificans TaxID=3123040 RepID=A0ABU8BYD8_9RHOB
MQAGAHGAYVGADQKGAQVRLYRIIMRAILPLLLAYLLVQRLRGLVGPGAGRARLGLTAPRADVWLHGASNGELTSVRPLLAQIIAARPGLAVLVTSNTETARQMVADWGLPGVQAQLAPFDTPGCVARLLARTQAKALILLENELWPERIARMPGPVIGLGARMSAGSARNWQRLAPHLIAATLHRFALVSAQDAGSEARLCALGLPADRLAPRLMLKAAALQADPVPPPFPSPSPRHRILLAASTHEGEEDIMLDAFMAARAQFDLLILAPRHPRRSAAVAAMIAARGLDFAIRSQGETPGPGTAVYLADTLGEMGAWYGMAGATVIGGSFADRGGHTPFEPAAHGSALLHGPSTSNFLEIFQHLDQAEGAISVANVQGLGLALAGLNADLQARLAAQARQVLAGGQDTAALLTRVLALIDQARG